MFNKDIREYDLEKNMGRQTNKILKNKKLTTNQKVTIIADGFSKYFISQISHDAYMQNLELNYEYFMIKDGEYYIQHNLRYEKCFDIEFENILLVHCIELCNAFNYLIKQDDFDFKQLSDNDKLFVKQTFNMQKECNFGAGFDGSLFYLNLDFRHQIVSSISNFYKFATTQYKKQSEEEKIA